MQQQVKHKLMCHLQSMRYQIRCDTLTASLWLKHPGNSKNCPFVINSKMPSSSSLMEEMDTEWKNFINAEDTVQDYRYRGQLVEFLPRQQMGIIKCPTAEVLWQKDVWISSSFMYLASVEVGDHITFKLDMRAGQPWAAPMIKVLHEEGVSR